jgi:two-component system response regulator YesN
MCLTAGKMFAMRLSINEDDGFLREYEERCALTSSAKKLFDCLRDFQRERIGHVRDKLESEAIRPIRIAKQYIMAHFSQPITLDDVCAATGFSASYFSTMFKKETGEGFSKYLTRVRIDRAKELLVDTGLSISEICGLVGYSDLKHFTGTFKKMTSLNPGQYRKLYG